MPKGSIREGDIFGRLKVLRKATREEVAEITSQYKKRAYYLCECSCKSGAPKFYRSDHLKSKKIRSCGCFREERGRETGRIVGPRSCSTREGLEIKGLFKNTNVRRLANLSVTKCAEADARNSEGHRGIYRKGEKFIAEISFQGKKHYLGCFQSLDEAIDARKEAEKEYFFPVIKEAIEAGVIPPVEGEIT